MHRSFLGFNKFSLYMDTTVILILIIEINITFPPQNVFTSRVACETFTKEQTQLNWVS